MLRDGCPFYMVKLVDAVKNYHNNRKNIIIDVEDGIELVWVIVWHKQNECTAVPTLIHECESNGYICVVGEVTDYYGVHEIVAFDVHPVSSGNEVTCHFLEVAYSFEKMIKYAEDEMLRAINLKKLICKQIN